MKLICLKFLIPSSPLSIRIKNPLYRFTKLQNLRIGLTINHSSNNPQDYLPPL